MFRGCHDEIRIAAKELYSRRETGRFGEIAVVAGGTRNNELADIFRMLAQVDRPLHLCATIHAARRWLANRRDLTLAGRNRS